MKLALTLAALTLTGCMAGPTLLGAGNPQEMRADLKACTRENWAFEFIPDFGITADYHEVKCMKQRGWRAGPSRGGTIRDYARIGLEECPDHYTWNGNGCSAIASAPATGPATATWATGE